MLLMIISLVSRPLYFVGVENEGLVHTVHACVRFLTTMLSHSFMMNCTDVGVSKVSMDGLNCTYCCIATYEDSAA